MLLSELKSKHRTIRDSFHPNLALRTHRALSWLKRAEMAEDLDSQFIFLWISFNAAYATDIDEQYRTTEKGMFELFFGKLVAFDTNQRLYNLVWSEFSGPIRLLLDNQYIYQPFWDYQNGRISDEAWKASFKKSKSQATVGLGNKNTTQVLSVMFRRIYTLRNQLMHGGSTWNSQANRSQVKDCTAILSKLVPIVIDLMMSHPNELWGDPFYPLVKD